MYDLVLWNRFLKKKKKNFNKNVGVSKKETPNKYLMNKKLVMPIYNMGP